MEPAAGVQWMEPVAEVQWSWVDFELGEDVRTETRLAQDQKWKAAISDGRAHVSWREYNHLHASEFEGAISDFYTVKSLVMAYLTKKNILSKLNPEVLKHIIDYAMPGQGVLVFHSIAEYEKQQLAQQMSNKKSLPETLLTNSSFRLCARCRPLLEYELEEGAYDCAALFPKEKEIVLHDGKLARNGRRLTMTHKKYKLDRVWAAKATNDEVVLSEVEPLLVRAQAGFSVSLLCFGQTGTGKTYTLMAALHHTLKQLETKNTTIEVQFFELHGKKCYDLFSQRKLVHLRSDENEVVHVRGAQSMVVGGPSSPVGKEKNESEIVPYTSLWKSLDDALKLRSSEVTERNPFSSRSHAVCVIKLLSTENHGGKMLFVDLAGSERNYETIKMTPAQHRESADINSSLMALKDCFRAYHAHMTGNKMMIRQRKVDTTKSSSSHGLSSAVGLTPARAPYRASLLTRVLRECFVNCQTSSSSLSSSSSSMEETDAKIDRRHYTTIITTLSPTPTDTLHSINSLEHVVLMSPDLVHHMSAVTVEVPLTGLALSHLPIESWSADQVVSWLATAGGGRFAALALPAGLDGAGLMKLNMVSLSALFEGHLRQARQGEEGAAWVVDAAVSEGQHNYLGRSLWAALRREQQRQRATLSQDAHLAI